MPGEPRRLPAKPHTPQHLDQRDEVRRLERGGGPGQEAVLAQQLIDDLSHGRAQARLLTLIA